MRVQGVYPHDSRAVRLAIRMARFGKYQSLISDDLSLGINP